METQTQIGIGAAAGLALMALFEPHVSLLLKVLIFLGLFAIMVWGFLPLLRKVGQLFPSWIFLKQNIPLPEAARQTYEALRGSRGTGIAEAVAQTSKQGLTGILLYYANALAADIPVYGTKPLMSKPEKLEIDTHSSANPIEIKNGTASIVSHYAHNELKNAANLYVKRADLWKWIRGKKASGGI